MLYVIDEDFGFCAPGNEPMPPTEVMAYSERWDEEVVLLSF